MQPPSDTEARGATVCDSERGRTGRARPHPPTPDVIGRYAIAEKLGEGGMGVVYAAYDPELDRQVAVKLLAPATGDVQARARLIREAQALARLNHPNVVAVHDAGMSGDAVFIAMELVRGRTLAQWLDEGPHPWQTVLARLLEAGNGLAAAHAASIVHRDFKPSNVMIGDDGRVRVMDFGIARASGAAEEADQPSTHASGPHAWTTDKLTRTGVAVGTPRYMAPEQHMYLPAGPAADQFAFCVVAYEALYGQMPFEADNRAALMLAVTQGSVVPPSRQRGVPRRIYEVVARGLSAEPGARHPSVEALLDALGRAAAPQRAGRRWIAAGILGVAATSWALAARVVPERCGDGPVVLGTIWNDARRDRVEQSLRGTQLGFAEDTAARVVDALDGHFEQWAAAYEEACAATEIRHEQSAAVMELRRSCLASQLRDADALLEVLSDADADVLGNAVASVEGLDGAVACQDVAALARSEAAAPHDQPTARRVEALQPELARVRALQQTAHYDEALARAEELRTRTADLDHLPTRAEVAVLLGEAASRRGDVEAAREALESGYDLALESRADATATSAALELSQLVAAHTADYDEALRWARTAGALARRVQPRGRPEVAARTRAGHALTQAGRFDRAVAEFIEARALADASGEGGMARFGVEAGLALALHQQGRWDESRAHYDEALAEAERVLGAEHPTIAMLLGNLGTMEFDRGDFEAALARQTEALELRKRAYGSDHREIAMSYNNLGLAYDALGQPDRAEGYYLRARDMFAATVGLEHPDTASTLVNLAGKAFARGDMATAGSLQSQAVEIYEASLGPEHPRLGSALRSLGILRGAQGRAAEAADHYLAAIAIFERATPDHAELGQALVGLAGEQSEMLRFDAAITNFERGLAILRRKGVGGPPLANATFGLAQALRDAGKEPERALRLAESAREIWADPRWRNPPGLEAIDAWIGSDG